MFSYIEAHVSLQTFQSSLAQLNAGNFPSWALAAVGSCRKSVGSTTGTST
jgi:hypothetical protein